MTDIVFEGIDRFNRPIFKAKEHRDRYGSTEKLFDYGASEDEVLDVIDENDLCFFGSSFGCEPMGTPAYEIKIVRSE